MTGAVVAREYSSIQHFIAGAIYVLAGVVCFINHSKSIGMIINTKLFPAKTRIVHLHFAVASIGAIAGFPLAASSCFAGKWLWGQGICQAYAFEGFLSGIAVVHLLSLMAVDRFLSTCQPSLYKKLSAGHLNILCTLMWLISALWAAMPLIGYGRYDLEPQGTSCTIDWLAKDELYYTYMTCLVVLGFAGPVLVCCFCYLLTTDKVDYDNRPENDAKRLSVKEMNAISRLFFIITTFSWSGYAVVSVWSLLAPITRVPLLMTYLPPIMAKLGLALSPLIYSSVSSKCSGQREGIIETPADSKKD